MTIKRSLFIVLALLAPVLAPGLVTRAQDEKLKLEILTGHSGGGVLSVAVSPDGKFALTGGADQTAVLWELVTGRQLRRFVGHEAAVSSVAFSKDGTHVLTASHDKTARLWETATGRQVRIFVEYRNGLRVGHSGKIRSAAISADGNLVATSGEDKTARIWDLKTGKQLFQIDHTGRVNSIAFSPDSEYVLTGGEDKIARLYSTKDATFVRQFAGHTGEIESVAYSADGNRVLTGSPGMAFLWNAATGDQVRKFSDMVGLITYGVAISRNGETIYAGGSLFDVTSGKRVGVVPYTGSAAAIAPDGRTLIAPYVDDLFRSNYVPICDFQRPLAKRESHVFVFDLQTMKEIRWLAGRSDSVNEVAIAPDHRSIFTAAAGKTSSLWNMEKGHRSSTHPESQETFSAEFSSDGRWIVTKEDDSIVVRDASDGRSLIRNEGSICWNRGLAVFPDGRSILAKQNNVNLTTINLETLVQTRNFSLDWQKIVGGDPGDTPESSWRANPITTFALSPDGKTFGLATESRIGVWHVGADEIAPPLQVKPIRLVQAMAFSPDGKTVATASAGEVDMLKVSIGDLAEANSVQFWDVETGKRTGGFRQNKVISDQRTGFRSIAYSADGKFVAAGSFDGRLYLWDLRSKVLKELEGHTDVVNSVKFSADGKYIVSGSSDSTTRIWNAATGDEICKLVTFHDGTWAVVDPMGRYDAPNGGEIEGIHWVYGNESIGLNQLKDVFYTPNLLPRLLGYNKEPLRAVPDLNSLKLFPKIVEQKIDEATSRLTVRLQNRGGGIGEVRILINGKLASEDARDAKTRSNPNVDQAIVTFDLKGSAGFDVKRKNTVEVITNNYDPSIGKGYISSRSDPFDLDPAGEKTEAPVQPKLYAIVGGVSDYNGTQIDLRFAAKDAEDFAHALSIGARRLFCPKESPNCSDKVNIDLLTTSGKEGTKLPTKANFKEAFREVAKKANPEDVLVIYLSGHGTSLNLNGADTYLYFTQEADKTSKESLGVPGYREGATISSTELLDWLTQELWLGEQKGIQARKQVMILDTCAAGAFEKKLSLQKDLSADQIKALERLKDRTGFQILMGSSADAVSYEASQYGQGLLTYALLQGMKGAKLREGKYVDTQLLFGYAADEVPKIVGSLNGGIQKPRIFGSTGIDIGLMNDQDKDLINLESVKPVFLRPRFSSGDEGDDPLRLIDGLRSKLEEMSAVRSRSGGRSGGAELVYIDDDGFPNAFRITGTYQVEGENVRVKAFLRKDGKTVSTLAEIFTGKDKVIDALTTEIRSALSKLPGS